MPSDRRPLEGLSGIVYGAYIPAAELETAWVILKTEGKGKSW